jgi:hypothetical protein
MTSFGFTSLFVSFVGELKVGEESGVRVKLRRTISYLNLIHQYEIAN